MTLRYFTPQPLRSSIRSFSILQEPETVFNKRIIVPDSFPALLINLGAPFVWERENGEPIQLPDVFFVRPQPRVLRLRATGFCQAIGVNLFAWDSRFFVGEQVDLKSSPIIPLDGIWQDFSRLAGVTFSSRGEKEALATLAHFVEDLTRRIQLDTMPIRRALEMLYATNGQYDMQAISAQCFLSPSQLERRSNYLTGLSPKTLARLIRFDASCSGLLRHSDERLTDLAHFIHEFKTLADCTPREARAYVRALAADAEFLQFS